MMRLIVNLKKLKRRIVDAIHKTDNEVLLIKIAKLLKIKIEDLI